MKDWLRTYGAFVAIAISLSAWFISNRLAEEKANDAKRVCESVNGGRMDANRRLTHFIAMSDTLTNLLEEAATTREQTAAILRNEDRVAEAQISGSAARKYRQWAASLEQTEELLTPYPLLDCA